MRNEKGITLVELLAVLAIIGIIMTLLTSIFINGKKSSDRSVTNQMLQQEANLIIETIRKEYLELVGDDIKLEINSNTLQMNGEIISEGYEYIFIVKDEDGTNELKLFEISVDRNESRPLELTIKKDKLFYTINTTLSKLH